MATIPSDEFDFHPDFPVTKNFIYMNNGAMAPTPIAVIKAMTDFMVNCAEQGPDSTRISEVTITLLKDLRHRVAHLINCDPEEVVFTQSTTDGINLVANGLEWKNGNSIIVRGGNHEHHANYLPWLRLAQQKSIVLKELAIDENGFFDLGDLEKAARGSKMISMSHALYNTGAIMPLEEVGKIAGDNNMIFFVDAAQTAGTVKIDVKKIGCDFMAFPGFKWLCGPSGIGVFYCSKKACELITPPSIGSESATVSSDTIAFMDMPARLQTGFRNYIGVAGLEAAIRYVLRIGLDKVRDKNLKVANSLRDEVGRLPGVKMYGPDDERKRSSIVTFMMSEDSSLIVKKLEENNMVLAERDVGTGKKAIRAAPHFFNTEEEAVKISSSLKRTL